MSILTGPEILRRIDAGTIEITPFSLAQLNPNSYNVRLGSKLMTYNRLEYTNGKAGGSYLSPHRQHSTTEWHMDGKGEVLVPGTLYLAETIEHTKTLDCVPQIQGRSSIGRLGIFVHVTAGFGDVGFCGKWTLELTVVEPVKVFPGLEIAQIVYHEAVGERQPYKGRYQGAEGLEACKLWRDRR